MSIFFFILISYNKEKHKKRFVNLQKQMTQ
jgi:hypothetical protein